MKDISKEEYDYAVFIVQSYHRQMDNLIKAKRGLSDRKGPEVVLVKSTGPSSISKLRIRVEDSYLFDLEKIRTGDFILSVRTNSDHITKGKKYEVIDGYGGAIRIKDDAGIIKAISRQNKFRLWTCIS
ncbi:hypothetical protein [Pedobacter sp. MR2016-24]|uniref:hypothetical protein n=1 Tax=Pedobacter sp. MR2016-24 TaxID=2994466 RepID=UPI00224739E3|nr:hypothetical protein [Pedobacter sp. MR2016-24]MCX2486125.1 hypothetical protein [Pedobacter sp. MR2016-24]